MYSIKKEYPSAYLLVEFHNHKRYIDIWFTIWDKLSNKKVMVQVSVSKIALESIGADPNDFIEHFRKSRTTKDLFLINEVKQIMT